MPRTALIRAVKAVERASDEVTGTEHKERLHELSSHLQSQIDRDATPALGTLDRIQTKLREIESETEDKAVATQLDDARQNILTFLGTLDDRGMNQHG